MRIAGEDNDRGGTLSALSESPGKRRLVWSEHLGPAPLAGSGTLRLLGRYGIELVVAVRPGDESDLRGLLDTAAEHEVPVHLWPMLGNRDGRWLSEGNATLFHAFVEDVLDQAQTHTVATSIALDLEPPFDVVKRWLRNPLLALRRRAIVPEPRVDEIVTRVSQRGAKPWAAVVPLLVADPPGGGGWHGILGTRFDPAPLSRLSAMLYSSVTMGYSRGLLAREDVRGLLFETARACTRRWGLKAAASVGAVGPGALGDEQTYTTVSELAQDVALVRAAGIDDIALFELRGVLERGPAERWLDALCHTEPAVRLPHRSRRVLTAVGLALGMSRLF